jgi:hypothetical protein
MIAALVLHCVIVAGLGGEQEYQQRFSTWAKTLDGTLRSGGPDVHVQTLEGDAATREGVQKAIASIAGTAKPDDSVAVILIGHGSFDGVDYKFIVPGPDFTATELAGWLDRVPAQHQLVVNTTSASGSSTHALERPNRAIVTATKSGTEKNATVFARYWADALRDGAADLDKNEVITAQEAFKYAEQKTKQFYETNKRLATEHPAMQGGDTRFALLRTGSVQAAAQKPEKRALLTKRDQLEAQIDDLKLKKAAMPTAEYRQQLQTLLLELARTQEELDK